MIEVRPGDNGRSVTMWSGRPLLAKCACGHRALVPLRALKVHEGDMSRVYDRPLVCSKCAGRSVKLWILASPEEHAAVRAELAP